MFLSLMAHGQKVLTMPEKYFHPFEGSDLKLGDDIEFSDSQWYVWSDRSNNPVFASPQGKKKVAELDFGEACAVIGVQDNKLLLAKADDIVNNQLGPGKEPLGWVEADNLLLWSRCLKTEYCRIDKKAMVVNNPNANSPGEMDGNLLFYNGVGIDHKPIGDAWKGFLQIYFVFKSTEDLLLLGKAGGIQRLNFSDAIAGWIPKNNCVQWNTNVALEINWHPDAVIQREETGNLVHVWQNHNDANAINLDGEIIFEEEPFYMKRNPGFKNRFFILEEDRSEVNSPNIQSFKVGFFNELFYSDEEFGSIEKELSEKGFPQPPWKAYAIYWEGHSIFKPNSVALPWFQYVMLMDRNELYLLRDVLRGLTSVRNYPPSIARQHLIIVLREIFFNLFGNQSNAEMRQFRIGELNMCLFYEPGSSKFSNISIDDLSDLRKVSDNDILSIIEEYEITSKAIEKIIDKGVQYPRIYSPVEDEVYYWIPVDIFPHDPKPDDVLLDELYMK